jgi:DNA-binding winged helix-turn-helix (wHTH) protein
MIYQFGPYRLEPGERRFSCDGREIQLRPKLFDLLAVLVENNGRMLEKEDLLSAVWPDTVVEENNLTVSITALRRVLGDGPYIETVSRRGYRFNAKVTIVTDQVERPNSLAETDLGQEPPGGAVPLDSPYYVARETDEDFYRALGRGDSIVLIKGARQVGKTSLLARGMQKARENGRAVVLTDLQKLSTSAFESVDRFLLALAESFADQQDLSVLPGQMWNNALSPSSNFERYLRREVLVRMSSGMLWALDETDRLFNFAYANEVFGLFRSWHNLRALDPVGPWQRLTLALAYATEAHLFITDLNQSPFNVGTKLALRDFSLDQIADLNRRYGEPLRDQPSLQRFYQLIAGHPYLTQCGLYELANRNLDLSAIEAQMERDEGVFSDHLRRMLLSIERDGALRQELANFLHGPGRLTPAAFYRLRSAGVVCGDSPRAASLRCELYRRYLESHLQ